MSESWNVLGTIPAKNSSLFKERKIVVYQSSVHRYQSILRQFPRESSVRLNVWNLDISRQRERQFKPLALHTWTAMSNPGIGLCRRLHPSQLWQLQTLLITGDFAEPGEQKRPHSVSEPREPRSQFHIPINSCQTPATPE